MKHPINNNSNALSRVRKVFPNVAKVVDAKKDLDIQVTSVDTASRAVRNHSECALAHACKRSQQADGAIINVTTAYIVKGDTAYRYKLGESVSREIVAFDREAPFVPGEYRLNKPSEFHRLGNPQRSGSRKRSGNGTPPKPYHLTANVRRIGDLNS